MIHSFQHGHGARRGAEFVFPFVLSDECREWSGQDHVVRVLREGVQRVPTAVGVSYRLLLSFRKFVLSLKRWIRVHQFTESYKNVQPVLKKLKVYRKLPPEGKYISPRFTAGPIT